MNVGIGPREEWVSGEFAFCLGGFGSTFVGIMCVAFRRRICVRSVSSTYLLSFLLGSFPVEFPCAAIGLCPRLVLRQRPCFVGLGRATK